MISEVIHGPQCDVVSSVWDKETRDFICQRRRKPRNTVQTDNERERKKEKVRKRKRIHLFFLSDNKTREALVIVHANRKQRYGHCESNCTVD